MAILSNFQNSLNNVSNLAQPVLNANLATNGLSNLILGVPSTPNYNAGGYITNRQSEIMSWRLPGGSTVQMYINPQEMRISDRKAITPIRTKGGFVIQYWGEDLTTINLSGHTGSAGIEGINILRNIYRSEQTGFDLVAASQQQQLISILNQATNIQNATATQTLQSANSALQQSSYLLRPSLASLATSVILYFQGVQYKGFFTEFSVTESTNDLGIFSYTLTFMATSISGSRNNFMAWHKEPAATDTTGQLLNFAGNAIRGALGFGNQPPQQFFPETAPYTFGAYDALTELGLAQPQSATATVNIGTAAVNRGGI